MELPDEIYEQVEQLSEQGNDLCEEGDFTGAIAVWQSALALLPPPRQQWEASVWLHASIGDAYYQEDEWQDAKAAFFDAMNCPDAQVNPFVHYMLGKTLLRLDDEEGAVDHLLRAYMLDGVDIFDADEEEGPDALALLQNKGLVDEL